MCLSSLLLGCNFTFAVPQTIERTQNKLPPLGRLDASGDPIPENMRIRFGTKRLRPPETVAQAILAPDDSVIVSLCDYLTVWDARSGKELWRVSSKETGCTRTNPAAYGYRPLAFANDSKSFYTFSVDGKLNQWDIATKIRTEIPTPIKIRERSNFEVQSIDVSMDGERIALGTPNQAAVITRLGEVLYSFSNEDNGKTNAIEMKEGRDRLGFSGANCFVRFSSQGNLLAVTLSSSPSAIQICDSKDGTELQLIQLAAKMVRCQFSPDGKQIAVTERDNAVRLYDVESGKRLWSYVATLDNPYENYTSDVAFSPDGQTVVAGATSNEIYILDATTGVESGRLLGHESYPWSLCFTADSHMLYSSGWDSKIRRWDMKSKSELPLENCEYASCVIAASPDGKWLAVVYESGRVSVVAAETGKEHCTFAIQGAKYEQLAFSADNTKLAAGGERGNDVQVVIWDLATQKLMHRWDWAKGKDPHSGVEALVFSPTGHRLAAAVFRQSRAFMWDLETGKQLPEMKHNSVYGLDFSNDGETLVTVGWDKFIREWDSSTGEMQMELNVDKKENDLRMYAVSYTSTGDLIATAHMDTTIRIWNAKDMSLRSSIRVGESFSYGSMSFSRDGVWLASGSNSGRVRLWDPWTGEEALEVGKHEANVYTVGFGRDVRTMVSGASDGICCQWDLRRTDPSVDSNTDQLFGVLRTGAAKEAFQAMMALAKTPEKTVTFLRRKLSPIRQLVDKRADVVQATLSEEVDSNPELEFAHSMRRSISLLAQLESQEAIDFLAELALRGKDDEVGRLAHAALHGKRSF